MGISQETLDLADEADKKIKAGETARDTAKNLVGLLSSKLALAKEELADVDTQKPGNYEQACEAFLSKVGVQRQAYYSGAFIGRHVHTLLSHADAFFNNLVEIAGSSGEAARGRAALIKEKHLPLWRVLGRLLVLLRSARILADAEVDEVAVLCETYGRLFRETFRSGASNSSDVHISLKIHLIEKHVIDFVRRWRTAGLFCEDAAESIHALCNRIARAYAGIRDPGARSKAMAARLALMSDARVSAASRDRKDRRKRAKKANHYAD